MQNTSESFLCVHRTICKHFVFKSRFKFSLCSHTSAQVVTVLDVNNEREIRFKLMHILYVLQCEKCRNKKAN